MAKDSIRDYSATSSDNSDIQSVDISEGCAPSGLNNAIREVMTDLKNVSTGTVALETPVADSFSTDTISEKTSATGVTIDGVLLKDGAIGSIANAVAAHLTSINGGQIGGSRNLIINGNMACSQRATSATSITSNGYHTVDRWNVNFDGATLSHKQEQSTDTPNGFGYSLKITATTQDASLDANQNYQLDQRFEGQNLQQLKKGTSDAQSVTLSFWVKSSITGIFICAFNDLDTSGQRTVSGSYTINLANTWEYKTITFPPDTTGAFNNDNGLSARLIFCLAAGSNFTTGTLATTWEASSGGVNTYVGQTNLFATLNATWQITGIQLEVGGVATPFEHESFAETLQKCQRYFTRIPRIDGSSANTEIANGMGNTTNNFLGVIHFPTEMRANPTLTASGSFRVFNGGTLNPTAGPSRSSSSTVCMGISLATGGGISTLDALLLTLNNDSDANLQFSAEL
jgi:hypothetical protein